MLQFGINQHGKQITVNLRNEQGDVILRRQVSTQWKRIEAFFEQLRSEAAAEGGFVAVLEVCGFNDWLLKMLEKYGCQQTLLVQPTGRSKKKTDRRDASTLAEILWVNRLRLLAGQRVQGIRQVQFPSPQDAEDRQLTATRKRAVQLRTRTLDKVQRILLRHNLRQECPTKAIQTKAARKWLSELSLSEIDRFELNQHLEQWFSSLALASRIGRIEKRRESEDRPRGGDASAGDDHLAHDPSPIVSEENLPTPSPGPP